MYSSKYKTLVWNTSWYKPFDRGISKYDVSHNTSDPRKILKAIHKQQNSYRASNFRYQRVRQIGEI